MILGDFPCESCGQTRCFTDKNCTKGMMRCDYCETAQSRQRLPVEFRIELYGQLSIGQLEDAIRLARRFGAEDDTPLVRGAEALHYFALSAVGVDARLQIEDARVGSRALDGR